jgi:hypothetical protein
MLGCGDYPKITGETLLQTLQDYNAPWVAWDLN